MTSDSSPTRPSAGALLAVILLIVLACLPRFASSQHIDVDLIHLTDQPNGWYLDYEDPAVDISGYSFDTYAYVAYVEYLRGDFDRYPIFGPWRWRAVPSAIAAQLPVEDPAVALAIVSLGFALAGAVSVVLIVSGRGRGSVEQLIAGGLYAVSFPLIWYGTSGYVDCSLVGVLALALLLIERRRWWLFLALVPVGMLVKETYLIVIPVAAARLWADGRLRSGRRGWMPQTWVPLTAASSMIALLSFASARIIWTTPRTLGWMPDLARLSWNLSRPQAVGSFLLTCGAVLPLAALEIHRLWRRRNLDGNARRDWLRELHLTIGVGMGLLVAIHGFLTAYADGRHAWTIYPFATVLAARFVTRWLQTRPLASPRRAFSVRTIR